MRVRTISLTSATGVGLGSVGLALAIAVVSVAAPADGTTCSSSRGACRVVAFRHGPGWEEAVFQVTQLGGQSPFSTQLEHAGRVLSVLWAADGAEPAECTATAACPDGEPVACAGYGVALCGSAGPTAHCGFFISDEEFEATVRWCRGGGDTWPPWPGPLPLQRNPPPPPPKKPPQPPQPPVPGPGGDDDLDWFIDRIRVANSADGEYEMHGHLQTTTGKASTVVVEHVPGLSYMVAEIPGASYREAFLTVDRMVTRGRRSGPFLELKGPPRPGDSAVGGWKPPPPVPPQRPSPTAADVPPPPEPADSAAGGFRPETIEPPLSPPAPAWRLPPPPTPSFDLDEFSPGQIVSRLDPDTIDYFGLETCGGSQFAGVLCHRFDYTEAGKKNSAFFQEEELRLVSVIGEDKNGPRRFLWTDPDVELALPDDADVERLTGDPAKDMALMVRILGPS